MAHIIWTAKSLRDFEDLIEYIAKDAPMAARRFAQKMIAKVDLLQDQPLLGGVVLEDVTRTYREILQGNYRIIYRIDEEVVYLVAFHHAARLLDVDEFE